MNVCISAIVLPNVAYAQIPHSVVTDNIWSFMAHQQYGSIVLNSGDFPQHNQREYLSFETGDAASSTTRSFKETISIYL